MSILTILVPVDGTEACAPALDTGFRIGKSLGAHVIGLHVRPDVRDAVPLLGEGMSGAMIEEMIELTEGEGNQRAESAKVMFDAARESWDASLQDAPPATNALSCEWRDVMGREGETAAWHGRLADMIVVSKPATESDGAGLLTLNALLFESGRPVVVAPSRTPETWARHVAVAWNGSAQAARAVASALPILAGAESVTILTVESDETAASAAPQLATFFAWHGITAGVETFPSGERQVGARLLEECAKHEADLLVMGAYTHSRMRQLILGGVTKHTLEAMEIPVLMTH